MRRFRTYVMMLMVGAVSGCDNPFASPEPFSVEIEGPSTVVAQRTTYTTAEMSYTVYACRFTVRAVARGPEVGAAEWTGIVMEWFDMENRPVSNTITLSAEQAREFWGVGTLNARRVLTKTYGINPHGPQRSRFSFLYRVAGSEEVRTATYQFDCV